MEWGRHYSHPKRPSPIYKGLDSLVYGWQGRRKRSPAIVEDFLRLAEKVEACEGDYQNLSESHLSLKLRELRDDRISNKSDPWLIRALAAMREASSRFIGLKPYPVQIAGAIALHRGFLAEMATGEGKTLTAGLAAVISGWSRLPCHVITVNDYLVERDANWLLPLYRFCGIRVGFVTAGMPPDARRDAHECDVTYTTSKELLGDFLRDRLQQGVISDPTRWLVRQMVNPGANRPTRGKFTLRGLHTAIIDEADSVLIDEAVTPLIISSPRKNESWRSACLEADKLVRELEPGTDYKPNKRYREVDLTEVGNARVELLCQDWAGVWKSTQRRDELINQALIAREFFQKGKQYIIEDRKIVIVDEFTGRPMPQRTWRQGLHQAVEAKEGLSLSDPSETVARLSFQRFFRCFHKIAGMTGTGYEASGELWQIYGLPVVRIPTQKPCVRLSSKPVICKNEDEKWDAILEEIKEVHSQGRPILIGTRSVFVSELIADRIHQAGMNCQLLNASRLKEEAMIIAAAGERGKITVATNMAGRGTDIKLDIGIAEIGGLHVIATEHHESGRVDRQLFGRCARQGDPGSVRMFASLSDEILSRHLSRVEIGLMKKLHDLGFNVGELFFSRAQHKAERQAFRQRKSVLRTDTWLDEALSFSGS